MIFSNLYLYLTLVILAPSIGKLINTIWKLSKKIKEYKSGINPLFALQRLTGREFELWACDYLSKLGYTNIVHCSPKLDSAKNICCNRDSDIFYVQCRKCSPEQFVTDTDVEALLGSLIVNNIHHGIIITTSKLNESAKKLIKALPKNYEITIYDSNNLLS